MKILIAPDKFKGSLTANEVCEAIKQGIKAYNTNIEVVMLPLADGGEGFSEAIVGDSEFQSLEIPVKDPLNKIVECKYLINKSKFSVIEMANASGLKLLAENERNPLKTNTFGTGQLIKDALQNNSSEIIIGIGGSATNDAGMGMAEALGFQFFDKNEILLPASGENLAKVERIEEPIHKPWQNCKIKVACDVENPLFGINGAAYVFGPQKGANPKQVEELDFGLRHFSEVVSKHFGQDFHSIPGTGAAGGLGYGLIAFLGAQLKSGIDLILEANNFETKLIGVDLVITGEGKIDNQTLNGKVVAGVIKKAKEKNIPVYGICGICTLTENQTIKLGLKKIIQLKTPEMEIHYAIENAKDLLIKNTINLLENI